MANEEAREAALLDIFEEHFTAIEVPGDREWVIRGLSAVHAAGVAEGIRQAREAVATAADANAAWDGDLRSSDALAAIDALGEDDRG